jgi:DNA mismatch repair protein MutL
MAQIHILDSNTIDKIAAGEVVERPSSVVKELVENAIDAGASSVTVEAKDGGIEFLRVTDNGSGMEKDQLRKAFLRHATSKIEHAEDLHHIVSLGFRGEALSSIAAVSKVEVITKQKSDLTGTRIILEGGAEKDFEEVGAPDGTTFIMRNLFYNTPVRRKFLKQPATEGGYIADLMEHLALSRPDISFKFVLGNQTRFHTSGNGDLREVIYRIYGREIASQLVPIQVCDNGISIEGYLGKPLTVRSNRNFEIYYINGRFIKSAVVSKAVEEGYREYLMQHKFPLCVLHITMNSENVDVNVHPTKMDVRFSDAVTFVSFLTKAVADTLKTNEMIPDNILEDAKENAQRESALKKELAKEHIPEAFEYNRNSGYMVREESIYAADNSKKQDFMQNPVWKRVLDEKNDGNNTILPEKSSNDNQNQADDDFFTETSEPEEPRIEEPKEEINTENNQTKENSVQINFFDEKMLSVPNRSKFQVIGQVFDTYWLVQFEDKLFIIDQHAAHEKVKYERLMKRFRSRLNGEEGTYSQTLMPPVIVSLTGQEEVVLKEYMDTFEALGFEIESFGGSEYTLRSVPVDLYGSGERELFLAVLDEMSEMPGKGNFQVIEEKIASMSCKAAVKGNNRLSFAEAERLIDELLTLENPYNCPHGRPTIIAMSKAELEKKFKRIV